MVCDVTRHLLVAFWSCFSLKRVDNKLTTNLLSHNFFYGRDYSKPSCCYREKAHTPSLSVAIFTTEHHLEVRADVGHIQYIHIWALSPAARAPLFSRLIMADASSNHVHVLFSFSVFSRPSSVLLGSGYEVLVQKFLSIYGPQIDVHRKFLIQVFSEEWGQYVDLPKGFAISEKCKLRLIPLQSDVRLFFPMHAVLLWSPPPGPFISCVSLCVVVSALGFLITRKSYES